MELTHLVILLGMFDSLSSVTVREYEDCGQPPHIENAEPILRSRSEFYFHETSINYRCNPGYVGRYSYQCQDGKWINVNRGFNCRLKPCGSPGDILHGTFHLVNGDELVFGARIEYKCDEGYQLVGSRNYRDCEVSGWTGRVPYCEVKTCPPVEKPENGKIIGPGVIDFDQDYPFGSILKFECNSPQLEIQGAKEIFCLENRTWSDRVPKCKELQCKKPYINYGIVKTIGGVFKYQDELRYKCNPGYKTSGGGLTTCSQFGWSPQPLCSPITCAITSIEHGKFINHKWSYGDEESVEYTCNGNYRPSGSTTVQCGELGWTPNPGCVVITCIRPHSTAIFYPERWRYELDEDVRYRCRNTDERRTRCTKDGWNPPVRCIGPCSRPEIANSVLPRKTSFKNGDPLVIQCKRGFRLHGVDRIVCKNGEWVIGRSYPACHAIGCEKPTAIENGKFQPNQERYQENGWVTYYCNKGYELYGESRLQCGSSGWLEPPICIDVKSVCTDQYPTVEHGYTTSEHSYKVIYTCEPGYNMEGSNVVMCVNGNWSLPPTCSYPPDPTQSCGFPPAIDSGDTVGISVPPFRHGEKVKYQCQNYYILDGAKEIMCSGGRWTKSPRCLAPCIVTEEDFEKNGISLKWAIDVRIDVKHGDRLEFDCPNGFHVENPAIRYCRNGQLEVPRCLKDEVSSCTTLDYFECPSCASDEICVQYNAQSVTMSRPDLNTLLLVTQRGERNASFSVKSRRAAHGNTLKFFIKESNNAIMNVRFVNGPGAIQYEHPVIGAYYFTFPTNNSITFNVTFTGNFSIRFDTKSQSTSRLNS